MTEENEYSFNSSLVMLDAMSVLSLYEELLPKLDNRTDSKRNDFMLALCSGVADFVTNLQLLLHDKVKVRKVGKQLDLDFCFY